MSIQNAKSTLKVLGILCVILGILGIIVGIGFMGGGGLLGATALTSGEVTTAEGAETVTLVTGMVIALGVFTVLSGIVDILLGIFSVRASNDSTKIGPAYVFSIIALVLSVLSVVLTFSKFNLSTLLSALPSIVFSVVIFLAARTIKQSVA